MEIEPFEKGEKLDRKIKYNGYLIGDVMEVIGVGAQINICNSVLIDKHKFIKEVSKLADLLISKGFRKVILVYYSMYIKDMEGYLKDQFVETGNHPMIVRGWIPDISNLVLRSFVIDMLIRRRTGSTDFQDIIERYGRGGEGDYKGQILFNINKWVKYSPYQIKIRNEQDPDSYVSNVLNIAYPISKRPPTSMSAIARSLGSIKTIKLNQPNDTGRPLAIDMVRNGKKVIEHLIPVTRYSYSVEKGSYFSNEKTKDFCGTFYYWEPSSNIYLIMGKSAYYPNKIVALLDLEPENEYLADIIENFIILAERNNLVDKELDFELKYRAMIELLKSDDNMISEIYVFDSFFKNKDDKYIGNIFYAMEDDLDQPLCIAARKAGLDTVIFSRMPSNRRIVTELLDTRSREDSLNNLVWELQ